MDFSHNFRSSGFRADWNKSTLVLKDDVSNEVFFTETYIIQKYLIVLQNVPTLRKQMEWSCKKLTYLTIYQGVLLLQITSAFSGWNFQGRVMSSVVRIRCMLKKTLCFIKGINQTWNYMILSPVFSWIRFTLSLTLYSSSKEWAWLLILVNELL